MSRCAAVAKMCAISYKKATNQQLPCWHHGVLRATLTHGAPPQPGTNCQANGVEVSSVKSAAARLFTPTVFQGHSQVENGVHCCMVMVVGDKIAMALELELLPVDGLGQAGL